jgi:hypothetical protein
MYKTTLVAVLTSTLAIGIFGSSTVYAAGKDQRPGTSESERKKFCLDLKLSYNENISYYNGNRAKRGQWKRTADNIKTVAEGNNCSWATQV